MEKNLNQLPVYDLNAENLLNFSADELSELEKLAALSYSEKDMAMYFNVPYPEFRQDAKTEGTRINYHIRRGKLIIKANANMQLMISAEGGNLTAIQQLAKATAKKEYDDMLNEMYDYDTEEIRDGDSETE